MENLLVLILVIVGAVGILMGIPLTLVFVIFGVSGLVQYFYSSKKKSEYSHIYLVIGIILLLVAIIPWVGLLLL